MNIDIKRGKFEIICGYAENYLIAGLPDKKYDRRKGSWVAHVLTRNSVFLLERCAEYMTPKAVEAARQSAQRGQVESKPFPRWSYPFRIQPYEKQMEALDKSYGMKRFALYMEMGTGKTKTSLDLMCCRKLEGQIENLLVVCPNGVISTWVEQILEHCPFEWPVVVVESGKKQRVLRERERIKSGVVVICASESLQAQESGGSAFETVVEILAGSPYGVILDEAHYFKNHKSNRSLNVEHLGVAAHTILELTGTPITDGFMDLYMLFRILDPNIIGFGDYYAFRGRYAQMGGYENKEIVAYQNIEELMECIAPYVFQCTKEEMVDLPPKVYEKREVMMTDEQLKAIRGIWDDGRTTIQVNGEAVDVEIDMILSKYNAAQQIAGGFLNYDVEEDEDVVRRSTWLIPPERNPKIREVLRIAEENPHRQIIVWAKFRNEIAMLYEVLNKNGGCSQYHGGVSKEDRPRMIEDFRSGKNRWFLANQQTGGTGLTLNNSSLTVYFSNSFKFVERAQSEDRNHRIGQENKVVYVDLVATGSKDADILEILKSHKNIATFVKESIRSRQSGK